ncbi:MAG: SpoIIE family protein phosphatase [Fibromonadales bacterium]|nr:SpoIIE family protein phosphatase [Fibromonadales bacterium]
MRKVIHNALEKCVGCNHCVRVCPVEEANIVRNIGDRIIVEINHDKCITCGACQSACHHGSRYYEDDTERFFADLKRGEKISLFAAPAVKSNFNEWGCVLTWLRSLGVNKIYDVSLGADICTWAHIRHIQQNGLFPIISQPCPVVVNYILMHRTELVKHLSPVQSPMLCTAVYMRKYEGVTDKIAALSPCAAKTIEFEETGIIEYNVTIKNFYDYIEKNGITLPATPSGFDSYEAGLGNLFPIPGGLKENIEHYLGKTLRVDRAEGSTVVCDALDEYAKQPFDKLPVLFDVLNCADGCNLGTGCKKDTNVFDVNTKMDHIRQKAIGDEASRRYLNELYAKFDKQLRLGDFIRKYESAPVNKNLITQEKIDEAFVALGKFDEESKHYDCGACGSDRCTQMALKIAKGTNIVQNCTAYIRMKLENAAHESELAKNRAEVAHDEVLAGILYASKIQQLLLPKKAVFKKAFSDYSAIWNPSNIVGGDIYWIKQFDKGITLCVCDCTGHGTPGALLTMLVVSTLESVVWPSNCSDTAGIIWRLDQRLSEVLSAETKQDSISDIKDGCDIAVLFIAPNGDISLSAGHTSVFVSNGNKVERIKGQNIYVGEGKLTNKEMVDTIKIPANPANKFYIASDGLFNQPSKDKTGSFGYKRFEKIILENHDEAQAVITNKVWQAFEAYRGNEPQVDDFELISFKPFKEEKA